MKVVRSIERENEDLRRQVQELTAENQRLRDLYRNSWANDQDEEDTSSPPPLFGTDEWQKANTTTAADDNARTCTECDSLDQANEDTSDNSLKTRSRLWDKSFYTTPSSTCFIPFKRQLRLLHTALCLAQGTLWSAMRTHWPREQRSRHLEGPKEIKFGRDELFPGFGNEMFPAKITSMCGQAPGSVVSAILEVVYLRNALCHPGHRTTKGVDDLIQHAQNLAVVLQDERRAFKIRRLRDELQAMAVKAYEEIEAYADVATLPFAKPWPLHHQRLFSAICVDNRCGNGGRYSELLKRAAREWSLKSYSPGESDPRYLANVEKAKLFVRATEHGRRASVSDLPGGETRIPKGTENKIMEPDDQPQKGFGGW